MTIPLSAVRDPDCVSSFRPLRLDMGSGYVAGATAVLRRCLYAICSPRGSLVWSPEARGRGVSIFDLQNATLSPPQIDGWRQAIIRQLKSVDYVIDATAGVVLYKNEWLVAAAVSLTDGLGGDAGQYPLEVYIGQAGAAINNLGGG